MMKILALAAGGSLGTLLRYAVSGRLQQWSGGTFPWGTLGVNTLGCFAIGVLWEIFDRTLLPPQARLFMLVGLLGAFTTFSTFGIETVQMLRGGGYRLALANVLAANALGLAAVLAGLALSSRMLGNLK